MSQPSESFEELMQRLKKEHVNKETTPSQKMLEIQFDELMEIERKKGPISDKRYNSLCDIFSMQLGFDFSYKKITPETKMYRDARMRADAVKEDVSIEKPKPHCLQRLYFAPFSPAALKVMIESKLRPKSCAIYSFLCLNCNIASGVTQVSKYEILEKLKLSHKNAPSYFKELANTGLIADKSNHRSRKAKTRFYLPHTHQHAKNIFNDRESEDTFGGGDWVLITPEAIEILTREKKIHGTHWYVYAYLCLNTYRETGVTMKALPKPSIMKDLNPCASRKTIYRVFETLEELGLILPEKHKKDVFFLPHVLRKFAELSVKNGA